MKTTTLQLLESILVKLKCDIRDYEGSLEVGKKCHAGNPGMFSAESVQSLRDYLSEFNAKKRDVVACIKWVKSIEK